MQLRDYQRESIDSVHQFWNNKKGNNPLLILPTSAGKSLIQAAFCKEAYESYPSVRILCLTHVKELIQQNELEMLEYWNDAPTGVYSASLKRKEDTQILFAGIQSIYKKAFDFKPFDLIWIDEVHTLNNKGSGMYHAFIKDCLLNNPKVKIVGMTATPFRMDGGSLLGGDKSLFDGVAYNVPILKLIKDGYITPVTAKEGIAHIETKLLATQSGDYKASDQEAAFHKDGLTEKALKQIVELGKDRKGWMIFCSKVEHAEECAKILNDQYGIPTKCVHGGLKKERDLYIDQFKRQELRCLVSVGVLTTGFNVKHVDLIGMLRATKSAALWVQIIGRSMRLHKPLTKAYNNAMLENKSIR